MMPICASSARRRGLDDANTSAGELPCGEVSRGGSDGRVTLEDMGGDRYLKRNVMRPLERS
jgi:hypothetical protein